MTIRLKIAIQNLYDAFSKYTANPNMKGSPYSGDIDLLNKELFSKPLEDLTASELSKFTGKAMTTWGEVDDYKHFLPRIFELTAEWNTPYEIWIAFDKLEYGNWKTWEETEQSAIHEYMRAMWENLLKDDSEKAEWEFMEYFSALAHFYPTFSHLLETWENDEEKTATKHLANLVFNEGVNMFDNGAINSFPRQSGRVPELKNWLLSDKIVRRLEAAFYRYEHEPFAETLSWAEKMLSDERKNSTR